MLHMHTIQSDWIERTIELKGIDYNKHPTELEDLLAIDVIFMKFLISKDQ